MVQTKTNSLLEDYSEHPALLELGSANKGYHKVLIRYNRLQRDCLIHQLPYLEEMRALGYLEVLALLIPGLEILGNLQFLVNLPMAYLANQ